MASFPFSWLRVFKGQFFINKICLFLLILSGISGQIDCSSPHWNMFNSNLLTLILWKNNLLDIGGLKRKKKNCKFLYENLKTSFWIKLGKKKIQNNPLNSSFFQFFFLIKPPAFLSIISSIYISRSRIHATDASEPAHTNTHTEGVSKIHWETLGASSLH